jgi:hypothetical protein
VIVTVWVAQLLQSYAGPNSLIGRLIVLLGLNLVSSDTGAYFLGFLIILAASSCSGSWSRRGCGPWCKRASIPSLAVSNVYDLSKRFVAIVDRGATRTVCKACARCGASSAGRVALPCSG